MVLKEINLGKQPIYYVQKSYRKENGRPATKNKAVHCRAHCG